MNETFDIKCPHCSRKGFKGENGLNKHIARVHPNIEEELKEKEEKQWRDNQPKVIAEFDGVGFYYEMNGLKFEITGKLHVKVTKRGSE